MSETHTWEPALLDGTTPAVRFEPEIEGNPDG